MGVTVTATFLFTDLVDSTGHVSRLGRDEADELRSTHFSLLRSALDASGGTEVKNLGDGLMVMFRSTTRALAGAAAMQQAIDRHNRGAATPLSIRIGVSMGDATEEDGDYFGEPVIEASRLCAAAEGGQILTTELVAMVVGRHAEHVLEPMGSLALKGLREPVMAVAVRWEPEPVEGGDLPPLPRQLVSVGNQALFAFFGRVAELGLIGEALKAASADRRLRVLMVGGEPGMGKTTLAAQAARAAYAEGVVVAFGGCSEELCPPYGPWIGALSHMVTHSPAGSLESISPVRAGALRKLLPALSDRLPPGDSISADPDTERFLLLEAVAALLHAVSTAAPVVIVLDDVQWADDASVTLLRHLVASGEALSALVVATYRTSDVGRADPLQALLTDAHRDRRVQRIELLGLNDADVVDLMSAAAGYELGEDGVALAHAVHRETDGNAFFVTELLRHLAESGEITADADGRYALTRDLDDLALPQSVREVVEHRVARLGDEAVAALAAAAVIGAVFDVDLLRAVTDADEDVLLDLLDRAVGAALVIEGTTIGTYGFAHALVQHTMARSLSATRRQRLHLRVAGALEATGAPAAELARHWIAATRPADSSRARAYSERAGVEALVALAPSDAIRWYRQALDLLSQEPSPDERERCRLLIEISTAQAAAVQTVAQAETIAEAGAIALRLVDRDLIVAAALTLSAAGDPFGTGDEQERTLIRSALGATGPADSTERARLLCALAEATDARDWAARHQLVAEAVAVAERTGDRVTQIEILVGTDAMTSVPESLERRLITNRRAMADRHVLGTPQLRVNVISCYAFAALENGDLDGYEECVRAFEDEAAQMGNRSYSGTLEGSSALLALMRGRTDEAETLFTQQFEVMSATRHSAALPMYGVALLNVRRAQGRLGEVVDLFEAASDAAAAMPVFVIGRARVYAELGRLDEARDLFSRITARGFDEVFPRDQLWLTAMTHCADVAALVDDRVAAAELVDRLKPFESHMATTGMTFDGRVGAALAPLNWLRGDHATAERQLAEALEVYRRLDLPFWTARALLDRADLFHESAPGRAEADRAEARQIAESYGFGGLVRRAG